MHIHLDTVGGISGNMFVGAMLSCWPELAEKLPSLMEQAGFAKMVNLQVKEKNDGVLSGIYFDVKDLSLHDKKHNHREFKDIKETILNSQLDSAVKAHALGIFSCLAEAEAEVHGQDVESVTFHEVGAWDSIADIITAAYLIEQSAASSYSVSSLPMGNGQVETAHGILPVPTPAVTLLLKGFTFHDDGIEGERVTPTGAAILHYLQAHKVKPSTGLNLQSSGFGFGSSTFEGLSNVLRIMLFSKAEKDKDEEGESEDEHWENDRVLEFSFEVDDQTAEDLAVASDKLRQMEGVLDITQQLLIGKKQRGIVGLRLLLKCENEKTILAACFNETSTLGVRRTLINRSILPRINMPVEIDDLAYHAKIVQRPNGELTVKAELDDYAREDLSHNERVLLKQDIEAVAFEHLMEQAEEQAEKDE